MSSRGWKKLAMAGTIPKHLQLVDRPVEQLHISITRIMFLCCTTDTSQTRIPKCENGLSGTKGA